MPSLNLLVVGDEKSLPDFEDALESCKRYVGPIKLFTAHKAVDAEEFSETLRKVIKEKYPDVPVICWGNPKKGGDLNKHYHATLEFSKHGGDVNAVVDILKQVQAGQIRPDYLHKDQRKSLERRNSLDRSDSIRGVVRSDSLLRRSDSRRGSVEGSRPPTLDRVASSRRSLDVEEPKLSPGGAAAVGGMQSNPTLRRKGSLETHGAGGPQSMAGFAGGSGNGSMNAGMGMGVGGGMGMGMGMAGMHNVGSMNASMGGMSAAGMGGMPGMGMGGGSMNAAMGMGMGGMGMGGGMGLPNAMGGMGGMMPGAGMGGGGYGGSVSGRMSGMGGAPMGGGGDVTAMMAGMSMGGGGGGVAQAAAPAPAPAAANPSPNAELIRMLAEEVVRLRKAVEEKRARDSEAAQLRELQQQQMLLQQQLAAVGGGGVGSVGGMPMGI
ncbi:hypothetical protein PLESTF_001699900 [Pleodorina starrii]|nr:hypothetical protein PLESTF_001699900 [Pleodorina starrii]